MRAKHGRNGKQAMTRYKIITELHEGISNDCRDFEASGHILPAGTTAEQAEEYLARHAQEMMGSYGNIGCGYSRIETFDDGEPEPDEPIKISRSRAESMAFGTVWDGNNMATASISISECEIVYSDDDMYGLSVWAETNYYYGTESVTHEVVGAYAREGYSEVYSLTEYAGLETELNIDDEHDDEDTIQAVADELGIVYEIFDGDYLDNIGQPIPNSAMFVSDEDYKKLKAYFDGERE